MLIHDAMARRWRPDVGGAAAATEPPQLILRDLETLGCARLQTDVPIERADRFRSERINQNAEELPRLAPAKLSAG